MKNLQIVLFLLACFLFTGCAAVLVGAGVGGGIAISKDSASVNLDKSFDTAWSVTFKQIEKMGAINFQDKKSGKIEANIQNSKVTAKVTQLTKMTINIEIKARKNLLPNVSLAQEILNQIIQKL